MVHDGEKTNTKSDLLHVMQACTHTHTETLTHTFTAGGVMDQWLSTGCASCICTCTHKHCHKKCIHITRRTQTLCHTVNPLCKLFTAGKHPIICFSSQEEEEAELKEGRKKAEWVASIVKSKPKRQQYKCPLH